MGVQLINKGSLMKKLFLLSILLFTISVSAQAPNRLFAVRNGNGIVDGGVAQDQAIYIVFKGAAAKLTVTDALCDTANFKGLIRPAGETANQLAAARRQFAMDEIKAWLNAKIAENRQRIIEEAKAKPDVSDLP